MPGVVAFLLLGSARFTQAQPALQNAVLTDQGVDARQRAREAKPFSEVRGAEAGPVKFALGASYSLEFNDNVNTSEDSPEGDLIQTPMISLAVSTRVSERSALDFQVGLGYRAYWHNTALSGLIIAPGSEIAYDLQAKNVFVTLFDRFSFTEDPSTAPDLADVAQFPRFENIIGAQAMWLPGDFLIAGGYSFRIYKSTSDDFSYVDNTSHLLFLRAGYVLGGGSANAGIEFTGTLTDYTSGTDSDNAIVSFGPYLIWQVTDNLRAGLHGGFLYLVNSLTLLPDDSFNADSYYVRLDASQTLTEHISHGLFLDQGVRPSVEQGASFTEETQVNYRISWAFIDPASVRFDLNYVHGEQTVAAGVRPSEIYDQWRIGVGLSYALSARFSGDLAYGYVVRESDLAGRSYNQNRVTLGLSYRFE